MAETLAMVKGTEVGARLRAAVVSARGTLNLKDWEETAGVTADSQAAERALFQTVCAVAPPGLSPEDFQVGPPPA